MVCVRSAAFATIACIAGCGRLGFDAATGDAVACSIGETVCASGCADLQNDRTSCGTCGHDCLGGACLGGRCQPIVLASNQASPFGIALDADTVYWANNEISGSFASCPKAGCANTPTILSSSEPLAADVFVHGTDLYMSDFGTTTPTVASGRIMRCTAANCAATLTTLATTNPECPVALVVDDQWVYFTASADGNVQRVSVNGGTPSVFAADSPYSTWYGLAIDATQLYFTGRQTGVFRCALAGCGGTPTRLAAATAAEKPFDLAIDDVSIYWTEQLAGRVRSCPLAGCPAAGPTTLASGQGGPRGIAVDARFVYWVNDTSRTVVRCPISSCAAGLETIAVNQGGPWEIVVDDAAAYWTDSVDGTVMKLAKP